MQLKLAARVVVPKFIHLISVLLFFTPSTVECQVCNAGFASYNFGNGVPGEDSRQFLLPTLNFTCRAQITQWSLAVEATNLINIFPGIAVQIWTVERNGCFRLKQEEEYSQFAIRGSSYQLTLSDVQMDVDPGDFIGYYVYEEGLSPYHGGVNNNVTVLEIQDRKEEYCLQDSQEGEETEEVTTLFYSPMITVDIATSPYPPTPSSGTFTVAKTIPPRVTESSASTPTAPGGAGTGSQPTTLVPDQLELNEVGLGIGILLGLFSVVILATVVTVSFVLLFILRKKKNNSSSGRWRRSTSSFRAALEGGGSLNQADAADGESSLRRTQTTETNLDVYSTISDVEVGKFPVLPYDTSSNTEYAEPKCVTTPGPTVAKNPIYYFPSQTEREVDVYSTLNLGQTEEDVGEEYSHLSLRTVPSLDTPSQVERMYSHLATEPFWEPPTQKDALYNTLSTKRFLEIPRSSILCSEVIGCGAFGTVHQGEWKVGETELEVGIKMVRDASSSDHLSLLRQAAVMGQFSHPSIVNLYGVVSIGKPTMLVMELMKGGQLDTFLDTLDKTEDHKDLFLSFSSQLVDGACYLEGKGFIHRDLAAHSILLNGDHTVCKISNFGLSRGLGEQDYYAINGGNIPIKWTSPETLLYRKHSHASDVWSFGMLLYEVWSVGGLPFENWTVEEILKGLHDNYHHPIPETCPQDIYQIMLRCWNYKAEERPTFAELKEQISNI